MRTALKPDLILSFRWVAVAAAFMLTACSIQWVDFRTHKPAVTPNDAGVAIDLIGVNDTVDVISRDPVGGGTFAFVAAAASDVWVGPTPGGDSIGHVAADGTIDLLPLTFFPDTTGVTLRNPGATSIGFSGCTARECGPDGEDGRGLLATAVIAGSPWLVLSGARTDGDFNHLYVGRDVDGVLEMRYVDVSALLSGASEGLSAAHVFRDKLYLGVPDAGGARPFFLMVGGAPPEPGLDLSSGQACDDPASTGCDVEGKHLPALAGAAPITLIDAIGDFDGRLYLGNNGGLARATVELPASAGKRQADWLDVTPSDAAWHQHVSVTTTKRTDLEPPDHAIAGFASGGGSFAFARNTADGPQVWICHAPEFDCSATSWQLVDTGDGLTSLGAGHATTASLVVAHAGAVVVGFDAPEGVELYATIDGARFFGAAGCDARDANCTGLDGPGLGDPTQTRILSGASDGAALWLVIGDGASPPHLVRITPST